MEGITMTTIIGGTKRVPLTQGLLELIIMLHDRRRYLMSKASFEKFHFGKTEINWNKEMEKYFNSIEPTILSKYHLSTNKISFEKVMHYRVTDEMLNTLYEDLPKKFTF